MTRDEYNEVQRRMKRSSILEAVAILIAFLLLLMCCGDVFGEKDETEMVMAIIGEAAGEPFYGQVAVACGIKNRPEGLQGVDGRHITRVVSEKEFLNASLALLVAEPDQCWGLIFGADMWCSDYEQCNKSWRGVPMIYITTIGNHHFFRRLTKGHKQ